MKHLEVLIVADHDPSYDAARADLEADGHGVTVCRTMKEGLQLMHERGLGFDVMLVDGGHDLFALDDLTHHRETANLPVICVYKEGQSRSMPFECDGSLDRPYTRRELIDAIHHALNQRGVP